jgi:hypothetical protein
MVNPGVGETRNECEYSLEGVRRLAGFQQVRFMSRRIQRHVDALGFGLEEVCVRLSSLCEANFHHSERYADDQRWHDVYLLPHPAAANLNERIYIKFRLDRDCVWIELCSFHPEGWT